MAIAQSVGQRFFPLDEELGLVLGRYTPRLQEAMTRLGSKLPFLQAAYEIEAFLGIEVSEPTTRRATHANGRACEALARQAVEELEAKAPDTPIETTTSSPSRSSLASTRCAWSTSVTSVFTGK